MINTTFEAYKLKRELKRSGKDYEFKRKRKNEFGEPLEDADVVGTIRGLYHEQNSAIQVSTGDTTQVRSKKIPMILCLYEVTTFLHLQAGDEVIINSKRFKVTGIVNIQEWNIIADISLEVIDNGIQT